MADGTDVKVRLSPEGVKEVVDALRKVRAEAGKGSKEAAAGVTLLSKAVEELKSHLPALGLGAVVVGMIALGKHALDAGDEIRKMSQRVGASAEDLSTLRFAMATTDVTSEQLEKGMIFLARQIVELRDGNEKAAESFDELQLSAADFVGKDTGEAFALVAERIGQLPDGLVKSALAFQLLGRGGAALIPLLNEIGAKGFAKVREEAEKMGLVFSGDFVRAAEEAKDQIKLMKLQTEGLATAFVTGLAPGLAEALTEFRLATQRDGVDSMRTFGKFAGDVFHTLVRGFIIAGEAAAAFFALLEDKSKRIGQLLADIGKRVAVRGAQGAAVGAGVGAAVGAPFAGVGAIPGAVVGAKAGAIAGGVQGLIEALTTADTARQTDILKEFSARIEEIMKETDPAKLAAHKKQLDAFLAGDDAGLQKSLGTKEKIATLEKRVRTEQISELAKLAQVTEQTNERVIRAEQALADARAAIQVEPASGAIKATDTIEGAKRVAAAEQAVAQARLASAREQAAQELAIVNLREQALLEAARKRFGATKEGAAILTQIEKQGAQERLAINVKLFQDLVKEQENANRRYRESQAEIVAIDKEVAANRKQLRDFSNEITLEGLSEEQKAGFLNRLATERLDDLRGAALRGNLEKAREFRAEVTAIAQQIARLGEGRAAERIFEEANSLFALAADARKLQAQAVGDEAKKTAEGIGKEMKTLKEQIGKDFENIAATIKPAVDPQSLRDVIESIRKELGSQKFTIQVQAETSRAGPALIGQPGYAEGGRIPGVSPSPKADDVLIRATRGEFMQPVAAVNYYGPEMMESIRTLQFPRYGDGGMIGGGASDAGVAKVIELRARNKVARGRFTAAEAHNLVDVLEEFGGAES